MSLVRMANAGNIARILNEPLKHSKRWSVNIKPVGKHVGMHPPVSHKIRESY